MKYNGVVIGIDGGGTATKALAATTDGRIIGYGTSGPSNCQVVGVNNTGAAVLTAARSALGDTAVTPDGYFLGLAGVGRAEDQLRVQTAVNQLVNPATVQVETDAYIALAGGTVCQPGVVVIAGTGSVAFGLNGSGQTGYSSGWGYLLGDEGSAYDLGRQGVNAALREFDGRGPATSLTDCLLTYLELERRAELDQIIAKVYQQNMGHRLLAGFARLVTREADAGDRVAGRIVRTAARELSLAAQAVLRSLKFEAGGGSVIITGGVFDSAPLLAELFTVCLQRRAPGFAVSRPRFKPVVGALLLALKQANGALTAAVLERLTASLPENLKGN